MAHLHVVGRPTLRAVPGTVTGDELASPRMDGLEALFSALDGRELSVMGNRWKIEVFSACEVVGAKYVQLALQGTERYMLTLRVAPSVEIQRVIPKLLAWLLRPTPSGEVLEILE